jgi:dihydroflavonol-4-reductase
MKVLVTGASGFVGSAVLRLLLQKGFAARALVRANSDARNLSGLDVEKAVGDLADKKSLSAALSGCDGLFHVAADYRLWTRDPDTMFRINVDGSRDIIRAALDAGVSRIVYTSSVAVLGIPQEPPYGNEETPVSFEDMIGPYKQSKFLAEKAVAKLITQESAPVVIVNPSTPIGPRDIKPTPTGRMIVEAASGRMPAFVDTGLNVAHVDDVAKGHLLAFEKGKLGERYVLGGENMTLGEILAVIAEIVGRKPPKIQIPHALIMPLAYAAEGWARLVGGDEPFATVDGIKMAKKKMFFSSAKAHRDLGYESRSPREALIDAIEWFCANGYLKGFKG